KINAGRQRTETWSERREGAATMTGGSRIGVTGLAVMGANLARNIARHGFPVAVHNRTSERTKKFLADFGNEGAFTGSESMEEFVQALERPRRIMVMVKAGAPVDSVIDELVPLLDEATSSSTEATRTSTTPAGAASTAPSAACASSAPACPAVRRGRCLAQASCPAVTE